MNIGFLGLGKLGLPVSLAVEDKGHNIFGYDISKQTIEDIKNRKIRYREEWVDKYLPKTKLQINSIGNLVKNSEIIFVPIQNETPKDWQIGNESSATIKSYLLIKVIITSVLSFNILITLIYFGLDLAFIFK